MGTDRWQRNSHSQGLWGNPRKPHNYSSSSSLTWFFVIVVDNVDVVVIDADVPMLEISLLVIVRLDCLSGSHYPFPERRHRLRMTSKMASMWSTWWCRCGQILEENLFPRADNALPEGRGIARPNQLPPDQIFAPKFSPKMMKFPFSAKSFHGIPRGW